MLEGRHSCNPHACNRGSNSFLSTLVEMNFMNCTSKNLISVAIYCARYTTKPTSESISPTPAVTRRIQVLYNLRVFHIQKIIPTFQRSVHLTCSSIVSMISMWHGNNFWKVVNGHFSSVSGRTMWFVYATVMWQARNIFVNKKTWARSQPCDKGTYNDQKSPRSSVVMCFAFAKNR